MVADLFIHLGFQLIIVEWHGLTSKHARGAMRIEDKTGG